MTAAAKAQAMADAATTRDSLTCGVHSQTKLRDLFGIPADNIPLIALQRLLDSGQYAPHKLDFNTLRKVAAEVNKRLAVDTTREHVVERQRFQAEYAALGSNPKADAVAATMDPAKNAYAALIAVRVQLKMEDDVAMRVVKARLTVLGALQCKTEASSSTKPTLARACDVRMGAGPARLAVFDDDDDDDGDDDAQVPQRRR